MVDLQPSRNRLTGNLLFVGDPDDHRDKVLRAILYNLWLLHSEMNLRDLRSRVDQRRSRESPAGRCAP